MLFSCTHMTTVGIKGLTNNFRRPQMSISVGLTFIKKHRTWMKIIVRRCLSASTAWLLDTWPSSVDLSPASTDTGIYDLFAVASLTFQELDCQPTEDMRSFMLDRLMGTLFLSVSTTIHCLCLTLGISSNISTSPPTRTPSAFEVFLQLTRYITRLLSYLFTSNS